MALSVVQPAAAVTEMIRARLGDIAERRAFRTRGLAETAPQALQLSLPHPVFNLGIDDLASPAPLERAAMTGWRYLVMEGTRVVAAVEAAARWRNDPATYSHTNEGAFVQSAARLLGEADGWPEMRSGRHVIGLLRVPSLYFMALWLRDAQGRGQHDLFVVLDPAPQGLRSGQRLSAAQAALALRKLAQRRRRAVEDSN
jgi:hypothetical protein